MKCLFRGRRTAGGRNRPPILDPELARLTERADSIVEELDLVVKQMSEMLRNTPQEKP